MDESFLLGMRNGFINSEVLSDPPSGTWQEPYKLGVDALVLLADNREDRLESALEEIRTSLDGIGQVFVETGRKLLDKTGNEIEPFGFRDGISQPRFFDDKKLVEGRWRAVLDEKFGSYMVFRKLEQNVKAFREKVKDLSKQSGLKEEVVEAQIVGRFRNGDPLLLVKEPQLSGPNAQIERFNNFRLDDPDRIDYSGDPQGLKCPFHAHIRKTNPRDPALQSERARSSEDRLLPELVIARRGIPYDERGKVNTDKDPESGVGMLFMCYQASIRNQFEYIQKNWCNQPDFPQIKPSGQAGIDPLTGHRIVWNGYEQRWNNGWNDPSKGKTTIGFKSQVKLKGGEYFYAPPIPMLLNLKFGTGNEAIPALPGRQRHGRSLGFGRRRVYSPTR